MPKPKEIWKPVPGYPDYAISSYGRIRRVKTASNGKRPRMLKPWIRKDGYLDIELIHKRKGKSFLVHRLVALAFLGKPPKGYEVNHKNGKRNDAHIDNLEYVTRKENFAHARYVLKAKMGFDYPRFEELNGMSKLTEKDVEDILNSTESAYAVSQKYPISKRHVLDIREGVNWKHLKRPNNVKYAKSPTLKPGVLRSTAKLTKQQVRIIRKSNKSAKALATKYSICRASIYAIRNGKTYTNII